jgi:hypothetical protein
MQFTATKLFTAFLALIALMQFVSGAALYSEMTGAKIAVSVSDVALTDGCAPTVGGLFSLVFVFCWFRTFFFVHVVGLETKTSRTHRE